MYIYYVHTHRYTHCVYVCVSLSPSLCAFAIFTYCLQSLKRLLEIAMIPWPSPEWPDSSIVVSARLHAHEIVPLQGAAGTKLASWSKGNKVCQSQKQPIGPERDQALSGIFWDPEVAKFGENRAIQKTQITITSNNQPQRVKGSIGSVRLH